MLQAGVGATKMFDAGAHGSQRGEIVDLKDIAMLRFGGSQHSSDQAVASVGEDHVQPAKRLPGLIEQLLQVGRYGDVAFDGKGASPRRFDLLGDAGEFVFPPGGERDVHACFGAGDRGGGADAGACAGDNDNFAGEIARFHSVIVSRQSFGGAAILAPMDDQQLIERIKDAALLHGEFTLRSGRKSRYYLDKYRFETQPDILSALAQRFARRVDATVDRLAGAELGGIPLVAATSIATGKPTVLIRNQKKGYGTQKQLEGPLNQDDRILLLEDIATTGGQVIEAANLLTSLGAKVVGIIAVIDRQEGARENVEAAGFAFDSLFTKTDLGIAE